MKRALLCVVLILMIGVSVASEADASVFEPGYNYRYGHLSSGKYLAKINYTYIESVLTSKQSSAITHWNRNASAYVTFSNTSFSNADITVSTVTTAWEPGEDIFGLACLYDNEGKWQTGGYYKTTMTPQAPSKPGVKRYVQFCSIMLSPDLSGTSTSNQNRTLRHEMGHAIALGHLTSSSALMAAVPNPNDPDGSVTNYVLTSTDLNRLRDDLNDY